MMDPLHLVIAIGPLSAYFLLLAWINLGKAPFLTTGSRDALVLGIGLVGLVMVGPMELFLPEATVVAFGAWVWVVLLLFYLVSLVLLVLLLRPRIVIYNVSPEQMRVALAEVVSRLDPDSRWAGNCLLMPHLGVQLVVEPAEAVKNVQLVSAGREQNYASWRVLAGALSQTLRKSRGERSPYGMFLLSVGISLATAMTYLLVVHGNSIRDSIDQMLRVG
ncbi:MAG: hypothetical protein ACO1RA_09790 [Planctomycetaceae bacterium]